MELNFEGLGIQKWNKLTDRAQRVDEKSGVVCLVNIIISKFMFIKMSKMAHFLYILLMTAKY